jgi:imidazolonepropionase-like amidohydrolase
MDVQNNFIIEDVQIFTGDEFIRRGFVHVEDGIIVVVGSGKCDREGVERISRPNDSLIPGLIDAHIHALSGNVNSIEQSLRFGVTTVCDMHNEPKDNAKIREVGASTSTGTRRQNLSQVMTTHS